MIRRLFFSGGLFTILMVFLHSFSIAQATGVARLLGHYVSPTGGAYISGSWGWTDTLTGREYALLGNKSGTSIVEITNPNLLVERDFIPGVTSNWREIQTHLNYAYVVSEGGQGTQIIDLSSLPDSARLVTNFTYFRDTNSTARSHSLHIRDGYLYLNGCATWKRGNAVVIFDLFDPESPGFVWDYSNGHYVHDCFVHNDTLYAAAIYGIGVEVVDVTSKASPQYLYTISYTGSGTHNCATTTDGRYLLTTDEIGSTPKTLKIWDIQNPPSFFKATEYVGSPTAIVHNVFVKDSLAIMSYYTKGVKIVNIANPTSPVEIGGYDTYPSDDIGAYNGAWSVYPFFPSGKITIGDMSTGLYVIDLNGTPTGVEESPIPTGFTLQQNYPNPFNPTTTLRFTLASQSDVTLEIFNALGERVATLIDGNISPGIHTRPWDASGFPSGVYHARMRVSASFGSDYAQSSIKLLLLR